MAIYYVDSQDGADGNAGTSSGSAWQTLDKIIGNGTLDVGDSVLFRRDLTYNLSDNSV